MRVGKKPIVVEAKKTRSCIVRLEKVQPERLKSNTTFSTGLKIGIMSDEKRYRGPIKKRPITQIASPVKTKEKDNPKTPRNKESQLTYTETPPTIAAGRSRRAIKPNPKYASEDMVTPKIIKNVGALASTSSKKGSGRQNADTDSSSEDLYNRGDSTDDDDELNQVVDKVFKIVEDRDSDSEFSKKEPPRAPRPRGRPRKNPLPVAEERPQAPSVAPPSMPSPQVQQLRRPMPSSIGHKRKQELPPTRSDDGDTIIRKRILLTSPSEKPTPPLKQDPKQAVMVTSRPVTMRKPMPGSMVNGSKLTTQKLEFDFQERTPIAKPAPKLKPTPPKPFPNALIASRENLTKQLPQRVASPSIRKLPKEPSAKVEIKDVEDSAVTVVEDLETMPTFTIVNIHDIINKKTDVMISKTASKNTTIKVQKPRTPSPPPPPVITSEPKLAKRRTLPTAPSSVPKTPKSEPAKPRTPRVSAAAAAKKPKPTILNHTLMTRSPGTSTTNHHLEQEAEISPKPAPRILNATVGKKFEPVKPRISNIDDSADESLSLSMDEDKTDDEKERHEPDNVMSTYLPPKMASPSIKENSAVKNNLSPEKNLRKISPEKVVISREGDKVVRKVTAYETWYVVNLPEKQTPTADRNILELQLTDLANVASCLTMPSESWSHKVTLYEIPLAMQDKSDQPIYTGEIHDQNIDEEDRSKYQVSCVMFRRGVTDRQTSRLPYDRAVIFKNKTFFTNIEGKNVKLLGAPTAISTNDDVETLLDVVDTLTLKSPLVEQTKTM